MGDAGKDPVSKLAAALRELYKAAGSPSPSELKRQGQAQMPPVRLPSSTVSDWLHGNSAPSEARAFRFLVDYLTRRAQRIGSVNKALPYTQWELLLKQAQDYRRSNQGGRPARERRMDSATTMSVGAAGIRSAYREQVRRIAPPALIGRDAELAELAQFCIEPGVGPYVWWQADAWAGKSALLSTFVLHPPQKVVEASVRIMPFFITARLAAQDSRDAFILVLLEHLAELLGEPPPVPSEATKEPFLLDMMSRAAAVCAEDGGRLVLVVDGLDEDRGVTAGPDAHSIAALLPADPPHGMRVLVAGRPNPPIPDDVPDWHPLRDVRIVRPLPPSPYARDVRRLSSHELRRLLHGPTASQDVLGMLTSARGGLSVHDLEELTGIPLWEIEHILHATAGRTFTRRASQWAPGVSPEIYLLGHEELQAAATIYLGNERMATYRDRLHSWADAWHNRGWPPETPEYLLGGYYRLLEAYSDLPRMIKYATDLARHDRMLQVTGGDTAAVAEIRTALDRLASQDAPDPGVALILACHRDQLAIRNAHIPVELPAVWVILGNPVRAEALAISIADTGGRARALAEVATALAAVGELEQATALAGQAEAIARSVSGPGMRAEIMTSIAGALAATGRRERAIELAHSLRDPVLETWVLVAIAIALAATGDYEQAAVLADQAVKQTTTPTEQALAAVRSRNGHPPSLILVAKALAVSGRREQAISVAHSIDDASAQAKALAEVAVALWAAGEYESAAALAAEAKSAADLADRRHTERDRRLRLQGISTIETVAVVDVAGALAITGRYEDAEVAVRSAPNPSRRAQGLAGLAGALAAIGHLEQAVNIARRAEEAARAAADPSMQPWVLKNMAEALVATGQYESAQEVARSIPDVGLRVEILAGTVGGLVRANRFEEAAKTTRAITIPYWQAKAKAGTVGALALIGKYEQAEVTAQLIVPSYWRVKGLAEVAKALAEAKRYEQAASLAKWAEVATRSIGDPRLRPQALAEVAGALAAAGEYQQASQLARQAEAIARSTGDPYCRAEALANVAGVLASNGWFDQAKTVASAIANKIVRVRAITEAAGALSTAGRHEQAIDLAEHAEAIARSSAGMSGQAEAMAFAAEAMAKAGRVEAASRLAAAQCASGDWTVVVRLVLLLAPSTYSRLREMLVMT